MSRNGKFCSSLVYVITSLTWVEESFPSHPVKNYNLMTGFGRALGTVLKNLWRLPRILVVYFKKRLYVLWETWAVAVGQLCMFLCTTATRATDVQAGRPTHLLTVFLHFYHSSLKSPTAAFWLMAHPSSPCSLPEWIYVVRTLYFSFVCLKPYESCQSWLSSVFSLWLHPKTQVAKPYQAVSSSPGKIMET